MKKICLISCVKGKNDVASEACDLYKSTLFSAHVDWAYKVRNFKKEDCRILSAEHGLIPMHEHISPYEKTLNNMSTADKGKWARKVFQELQAEFDMSNTEFVILAGKNYYENLIPVIKHFELPEQFKGLPIGKRVQRLHMDVRELEKKENNES